jgi:hypothetical protein
VIEANPERREFEDSENRTARFGFMNRPVNRRRVESERWLGSQVQVLHVLFGRGVVHPLRDTIGIDWSDNIVDVCE